MGVGFFFILSGFVLAWSWTGRSTRPGFYLDRFARIYPLHIATTIIAAAIAMAIGHGSGRGLIASLVLVQAWLPDVWRMGGNAPSWSLSCEAFFYATFPFVNSRVANLSLRRIALCGGAICAAMAFYVICYALYARASLPYASALSPYTFPGYRIAEFALGLLLASAMRRGWRPGISLRQALWATGSWYGLLALADWIAASHGIRIGQERGIPLGALDLAFLPAAVLLVAAGASEDLTGVKTFLSGPIHHALGKASFALYLVQMLIIERVASTRSASLADAKGAATFAATITTCILVSWLAHKYVERPLNTIIRERGRSVGNSLSKKIG